MPGPSRGLRKLKQGQIGKLFGLDQNILVQVEIYFEQIKGQNVLIYVDKVDK